ncbi:hypothetical protein Vadar_030442 [Vaccinium darrowii]|uniref:Uncharacterized protein n=1 Tax=Vaccinium darrowii TaxID=229202 RepID=A0ACB7YAA9_9ERIC|nr:hypothetical protein Vadar_030442 [Vaccinium darrowii]
MGIKLWLVLAILTAISPLFVIYPAVIKYISPAAPVGPPQPSSVARLGADLTEMECSVLCFGRKQSMVDYLVYHGNDFNSKKWELDVTCRMAISDAVDFLEANYNEVQVSTSSREHFQRTGGLGIVIWDFNGRFRAARDVHLGNIMEPMIIEALAARESLLFAQELGLQRMILEGDYQQVAKLIQRKEDWYSNIGVLISDINRLRQSVSELEVSLVTRSDNSVAHCVAKNVVGGSGSRKWEFDPPAAVISPSRG